MNIQVTSKRKHVRKPVPAGAIRFYVGRPSVLGNPFEEGPDGTRKQVIKKYDSWLKQLLRAPKTDPKRQAVIAELNRIAVAARSATVELECWCAPLDCHAEVIKQTVIKAVAQCAKRKATA